MTAAACCYCRREFDTDGPRFRWCQRCGRFVLAVPAGAVMSWGVSTARRRPGDLLTRGDVCHVHGTRAAAERCGAALGGAPDPGPVRDLLAVLGLLFDG